MNVCIWYCFLYFVLSICHSEYIGKNINIIYGNVHSVAGVFWQKDWTGFKCRDVGQEMECISYKKNNLLDINGYVLTKNQFLKLGKYKRRKIQKKCKYRNVYSSVNGSDSYITLDKHQRHIKRNLIFHTN